MTCAALHHAVMTYVTPWTHAIRRTQLTVQSADLLIITIESLQTNSLISKVPGSLTGDTQWRSAH